MLKKHYGDAIWTNHALERLVQRGLPQKIAWEAFQYPEVSTKLDSQGTMEYKKSFSDSTVTVIAKKNDQNQWIIVSCWVDPPLPGTIDHQHKNRYHQYQKAGFFKKILLDIYQALTGRDY